MDKKTTFGVIVGNRGFFPDELAREGREEILKVIAEQGYEAIALSPEDTLYGSTETWEDAQKCAALFKAHSEEIDGIIVTLPNFGDEKAIANAIRLSKLDVPVLVQATPDDPTKMGLADRRDSFCGKLSACNNLKQYGIKFSLTTFHTESPSSQVFIDDLDTFARICRVVKGLRNARLGAIGARPAAFNTVRYSEKILEACGISVETVDLSDILGVANGFANNDTKVVQKLDEIRSYICTDGVPEEALIKMAKFGIAVSEWIGENTLDAVAIQCWTSLEENYGIVPCTVMSMLSESLIPSACEVDITGALSMYALQLASGKPSAIVDWNNNFGDDPDKAIIFHCSNFPKSLFLDPKMSFQDIIAGTVGAENTYGTCAGQLAPGAFTYLRMTTDDVSGAIAGYLGEGQVTEDTIDMFGGWAVVEVPDMQILLRFICENQFEHHVAMNMSQVADVLDEALNKYLGWDVYLHSCSCCG